jgi:enoyl-CoA hydratase/carnithine racemase
LPAPLLQPGATLSVQIVERRGVRVKMINIVSRETVAVVKLNRGVTNPLNLGLVNEIREALQTVKSDPETFGLVLTGSNEKFFSIGFDIPHLFDLSREDVTVFYRTFNQACMDLFTLPKPTVAAIGGHAIAGGCILALCCDYRMIADGRKLMGLNEIRLGVPVPYPADCILRSLVGARRASEIMETGEFYQPAGSLEMGMVDRVLPLQEVLPEAIEKARLLGSMPGEPYRMIKRSRTEIVEDEVLARWQEKENLFLDCWYSDEARRRLKEAMEKF